MRTLSTTITDEAHSALQEIKKKFRSNNIEAVSKCILAAYNFLIKGAKHE